MKDPGKQRNYIPREELTAYERWELPLLDEQGNEVAVEEEVRPLTAADIEAIREAAKQDGLSEGRESGYREGHEEGRKKGHDEGYQAGLEEGREAGRRQGLDETRSEVNSKLDRLEHLLGELLLPVQRHQDELETALVNLTTVLSRAVIFRELSLDSSHIGRLVSRAMDSLPSTADKVRIRLNPADAEWVREVAGRFEAEASVLEDESVLQGGCRLETRHSLVDYTVEKRFQKAVQSMLDQPLGNEQQGESAELDAMMDDLTDFHTDVLREPGEPIQSQEPDHNEESPGESSSHDHQQSRSDDDDSIPG